MHFHTIVPRLSRESMAWLFIYACSWVWDVWGLLYCMVKWGMLYKLV